ncbi:uncharacterized protein ppp1r3ab [Megalops cyprinoides]|uniref:uncharacterized protein ppp1r3ab n=1 Tax=Megalops cyprinoides TaxID=118141 RepID=UPI001863DA94|nr:uncharacterized protein ppp1r3ab [Megalops cyprinoides]
MEPAGQPRHAGSPGPLAAAVEFTWEGWGCEVEGRSSPLPQHGGSASSDESEPEPPATKPRRVSFADAFGLDLVSVKEFDSQDATAVPAAGPLEGGVADSEEYFLSSLFAVPETAEELLGKLQEQKCELECVELLPGTTALRGIIRVLNLCYSKAVYVRTTLDSWSTHFDLLAEFVPGSSDGQTDRFMFKLTLVPPFEREGARVEFCIRYETAVGSFWANNKGMNYVLFCHQRGGRDSKEKQQEDFSYRNKKSCLKTISKDKSTEANPTAISAETADLPNHEQEVVVRQVPETPVSYSAGLLHEDNRQKSLVENEQTVISRRRRRAARLARVRDRFSREKIEAQQGDEESGDSERSRLSPDISAPPLEGTTPHPLGIQDTRQVGGEERTAACDRTPPFSLRLDRGDVLQLAADANSAADGGSPDVPLHTRQELDTWRDASHTFVNVGDTHPMVCTAAVEDIAPQSTLWDSALAEPIIGQSDTSQEPPLIVADSNNQEILRETRALEADASDGIDRDQQGSSDLTGPDSREVNLFLPRKDLFKFETFVAPLYQQAYCRRGTESHYVTAEYEEEEQMSEESDDESQTESTANDSHLTAEAAGWLQSPVDSGVTAVDWLQSSYESLQTASDDLPNTDPNPCSRDERLHSQNRNTMTLLESRGALGPGAETVSGEGVAQVDECGNYIRDNGRDCFTMEPADLLSTLGQVETQTEAVVTTAPFEPVHTSAAVGIIPGHCDGNALSPAATEMDSKVHEPESNVAFTLSSSERQKGVIKEGGGVREKEEKKEEESIGSKKESDKEQNVSVEREELLDKDEEVSMEKKVGVDEDKNNVSVEKEEEGDKVEEVSIEHEDLDDEGVLLKHEDLDDEEVLLVHKDLDDEEVLLVQKDLGDEEVLLEHKDLDDEEVLLEHKDLDDEEVLLEHKDLDDEEVLLEHKDLDDEVSIKNEDHDDDKTSTEHVDSDNEEVTMKNEDISDEEGPRDNEFMDNDEISMENVDLRDKKASVESKDDSNDEELIESDGDTDNEGVQTMQDLGKEESETAMEKTEDFDDEEEEALRGMTEELSKEEKELSVEREEVLMTPDEEAGEEDREWEGDLSKKVEEYVPIEKDVNLQEAGEKSDSEKGGDANGGGGEPKEEGHSFREGEENSCREKADYEGEGDTTSTDSLTDDEIELHMYSVKSAHMRELSHTPAAANRNTSMTVVKRPSISRARMLPASLSSIRESLNEDGDGEEPSRPQEDIFHVEQPGDLATIKLPPVEKVENVARSYLSTWGALLSFGHVSTAFLYALLCLVFFITAYFYDFLACFALYLFSVYWLCFHGEKPRLQGSNRME